MFRSISIHSALRRRLARVGLLLFALLLPIGCAAALGPAQEDGTALDSSVPPSAADSAPTAVSVQEEVVAQLSEPLVPPLPTVRRGTLVDAVNAASDQAEESDEDSNLVPFDGTTDGEVGETRFDLLPTVTPSGSNSGGGEAINASEESTTVDLLPTPTPNGAATALPTATLAADETTAASSAASDTPQGQVNAAVVNLRGGPGTNYAVVGKVRQGTLLTLEGRTETGNWYKVCCPVGEETESWISAQFVEPRLPRGETVAALPVAAIPPTPEAPPPASAGGGGGGTSAAALAAAPAPGIPGSGGFGAPGGTNPLTGQPLPGGRSGQRPMIVCINNDYAARPQLGTSKADVLYEYLMEGYGITRFSAIYYGTDAAQIGPVRSARLINYYMGALYNAGLVCSGASDGVRYSLKHEAPFPYMDIDLDDPSNARYSVSIGSDYRTRLRTATGKMQRWLSDWGVQEAASVRGFTFGGPAGGGTPATSIAIPYPSGTGSQVSYRYDAGSGRYLRSMGGGPHVDGNTGAQLAFANVIVQYVPHQATDIVEDSLGSTSIRLNLFGSGQAILFRDGQAYVGTWRSESRGDLPRFYDGDGNEIALKPGRSWISVVPLDYTIRYQ